MKVRGYGWGALVAPLSRSRAPAGARGALAAQSLRQLIGAIQTGFGCARCLHNEDDPGNGPVPTTACVSFWAGLLTASYLARHAIGRTIPVNEQQVYLTPFRPESAFRSAVAVRQDCSICQRPSGTASRGAAA